MSFAIQKVVPKRMCRWLMRTDEVKARAVSWRAGAKHRALARKRELKPPRLSGDLGWRIAFAKFINAKEARPQRQGESLAKQSPSAGAKRGTTVIQG